MAVGFDKPDTIFLFDNDDDDCIFTNYGQPLKAGRIV
jgi:hypothetical protein